MKKEVSPYEVWFDGTIWRARKRGCPGAVFSTVNAEQALSRAERWDWRHLKNPYEIPFVHRRKEVAA